RQVALRVHQAQFEYRLGKAPFDSLHIHHLRQPTFRIPDSRRRPDDSGKAPAASSALCRLVRRYATVQATPAIGIADNDPVVR
ncbi:MAG: hypothetical protein OXI10_08775, partial [Gammaproteobacteria bacterium]|nr:hypothetical protein [Gammaproteobacteria bacterium]